MTPKAVGVATSVTVVVVVDDTVVVVVAGVVGMERQEQAVEIWAFLVNLE